MAAGDVVLQGDVRLYKLYGACRYPDDPTTYLVADAYCFVDAPCNKRFPLEKLE